MKSNKQPTQPPSKTELEHIIVQVPAEVQEKLVELLPSSAGDNFVVIMSRAGFIQMMNSVINRIDVLDSELESAEGILLDKERFLRLSTKEQVQIYRAVERRQASMRSDVIRVTEIGSRSESNRNYFGMQAQMIREEAEKTIDTSTLLTKPSKRVLSEISRFVKLKTEEGTIGSIDGESS